MPTRRRSGHLLSWLPGFAELSGVECNCRFQPLLRLCPLSQEETASRVLSGKAAGIAGHGVTEASSVLLEPYNHQRGRERVAASAFYLGGNWVFLRDSGATELGFGPGVLAPGTELFTLCLIPSPPQYHPSASSIALTAHRPAVRVLGDLEQGLSFPASVSSPAD